MAYDTVVFFLYYNNSYFSKIVVVTHTHTQNKHNQSVYYFFVDWFSISQRDTPLLISHSLKKKNQKSSLDFFSNTNTRVDSFFFSYLSVCFKVFVWLKGVFSNFKNEVRFFFFGGLTVEPTHEKKKWVCVWCGDVEEEESVFLYTLYNYVCVRHDDPHAHKNSNKKTSVIYYY